MYNTINQMGSRSSQTFMKIDNAINIILFIVSDTIKDYLLELWRQYVVKYIIVWEFRSDHKRRRKPEKHVRGS